MADFVQPGLRHGTPLVCDVYVKRGKRTGYSLIAVNVPRDEAFEQVKELRREEDVHWAYCTEPRETSLV